MCAAVIQIQFTRLTKKPCRKYFRPTTLAIIYAQKIKIASQKTGSAFSGIREIVAMAMISPNTDN
jgi:hypothetical protein